MGISEFLFFWMKGTYVKMLYAKLEENRMGEDALKIDIFRGLKSGFWALPGRKMGRGRLFLFFSRDPLGHFKNTPKWFPAIDMGLGGSPLKIHYIGPGPIFKWLPPAQTAQYGPKNYCQQKPTHSSSFGPNMVKI